MSNVKRWKCASVNRNAPFERLTEKFEREGNPIARSSTKKKEKIGHLFRISQIETTETVDVFDPEALTRAEGVEMNHTIYDLECQEAYVHIGTSRETSEFACDSIKNGWYHYGKWHDPDASSILMLRDGGGRNSSRHDIFKPDWQALVDEIGVERRIAHDPPDTSKFHPIEPRVFPHMTH